ncbi:MAG: maleylpyruvate isomerase family mycothiol-dependent enzyme [Actinomycetes bacterium]
MTVSSPLSLGLRERVLAASRTARSGGRAAPAAQQISPAEAFARAVDAFTLLLSELSTAQWRAPVLRQLDVQGLVGHLIGVERDVQRALNGDEEVADADHVASTQDLATAQAGRDPAGTRAEWRNAADRTLELIATAPQRNAGSLLSMHGMRLPVDAMLVVRAFELWTHESDIRSAVGMPPSVPDPSVLTLMTDLAVQLLPHALTRSGSAATTNVHLVLTGDGGGTWDLPMDGRSGPADAAGLMIVVNAVDFCRLVANRVAPEALDVHIQGDGADGVLTAAPLLALD